MAETALVKEKLDAGEALVRAADGAGVPLRAALWVYDGGEDRWTLALETDPAQALGPLAFSRKLHDAVDGIADAAQRDSVRDLLLEDVELFTRPSPIAQMLRPRLGAAASVSRTRLRNTSVDGYVVEGAVLYRLEQNQAV
jgi:hypothetical protein